MFVMYKAKYGEDLSRVAAFYDSATIHTAGVVVKWLKTNNVRSLVNHHYTAEYQSAEIFIRYHKSKMRSLMNFQS